MTQELPFKTSCEDEAVTGARKEIGFKAGTRKLFKRLYSRRVRRTVRRALKLKNRAAPG